MDSSLESMGRSELVPSYIGLNRRVLRAPGQRTLFSGRIIGHASRFVPDMPANDGVRRELIADFASQRMPSDATHVINYSTAHWIHLVYAVLDR